MRVLLVDGHYYLYRSFFAIRGLTNSRGEATNAIYGFCKALRKMVSDVKPGLGAVIWDCGLPVRRTSLQPAYKQNRPPMPDTMRPQETWLQERVPLLGFSSLWSADTEADDLIASYAREAVREGHDVIVATNDKDILTLAGERISIYSTAKADIGKEGFALLGAEAVRKKWGVDPAQIAEVLALTGDASDNIPGVSGVGEKTAARLVNEFGDVGNLLERIDEVRPETLREKLRPAAEQILANRRMVALDEDLPLPKPLKQLDIAPRYAELIEALRDCEFKGLLREVEAEAGNVQTPLQGELL